MLARPRGGGYRRRVGGSTDRRPAVRRGRLGEFVRLIFVLLFAAGGYTIAPQLNNPSTTRTLLGVVLGTGTGFVLGGAFGRQTAAAVGEMEREFRRGPAPELVAGTGGLLIGVGGGALGRVPLLRPPPF